MRILHATKKYPNIAGGDSNVVKNLEEYQKKRGHEVFILTSNCKGINESLTVKKFGLKLSELELDKINFKRIFTQFLLFFYSFYYLKKIKVNIVHSHSPEMGFFLSIPCWIYRIPIVNTCHGVTFPDEIHSYLKRKLEEFFLKYGKFNKIITVSKNSLEDFRKVNIKNVVYLPNGINIQKFNRKRDDSGAIIKFIFVGRLVMEKGIKHLLRAIAKLENKEKNFKVLIVGNGIDGKYLQKLTSKLKINDFVLFLGLKNPDEVINLYYSSDVFILPSLYEGFPITLLEAWAAELPVIISNVGGIPDICKNGEDSLIISPGNPEEIYNAMRILIKDSQLREKLARNGRFLIEEKYNWQKIIEDIEDIYKEISYEK